MTAPFATKDLPCLAATAAPTGLFLLDAAGEATYVNPRLAQMLGAPEEALLGTSLVARLLGESHVGDLARIAQSFALGGCGESVHAPKVAGNAAWVRVIASRSRDAAGIVGVVEDVTRARAEADDARRAEGTRERGRRLEALGLLAGSIAHDFNNLLVGIVGNATLAELDVAPDGEAAAALTDLRHTAERATELTTQLLAVGGRGSAAPQCVDAHALLEEVLSSPAVAPARARVACEPGEVPPRVLCDPARLRQVLTQLIANAVEATSGGGRVTVRTGITKVDAARRRGLLVDGGLVDGPHFHIEVEDNGVGMSPDALDRAFDPFVTTKGKRRGLGLSMVAATARLYRSGVEATSREGVGTTMRFLLPVDPAQPMTRVTPSAPMAAVAAPGAVLVVDDESAVRDVTRRLLVRQGFEVLVASSGEEAVELLGTVGTKVRFVLLDHSMPGMDGAETFRRLRAIVPDLHVVMTSGHSERELRERFGDCGVAGYLQKPFDMATLVRTAREVTAA